MWLVKPVEYTEWGQNTHFVGMEKVWKHWHVRSHKSPGHKVMCSAVGYNRKTVCVWVCAGIQAWEVAVYNVCVLTGLPCVQLHPELPSSHWAAPEYFLYQPSLPLSFFALLAQSDPIRLLFTAALWDTSTFSSYHPCSFFLFLLRNVSKHQTDGMTSQDLKCDYFENYDSLFCMFFSPNFWLFKNTNWKYLT